MSLPSLVLGLAWRARIEVLGSDGHSTGMCEDASEHLVKLLRRIGIKASAMLVEVGHRRADHVVVHIDRTGIFIDITGDQFNGQGVRRTDWLPPVYIGMLPRRYRMAVSRASSHGM